MRTTFRSSDEGITDLQSTILGVLLSMLMLTLVLIPNTKILPMFSTSNLEEQMASVGVSQRQIYKDQGRYPGAGAPGLSDEIRIMGGNNDGCFTMIGNSGAETLILESYDTKPRVLKADTTAHCVGEQSLLLMLTELEQPATGRSGKKVLQPPTNLSVNGSVLSWVASPGATSYKVVAHRSDGTQSTATVTSPAYTFTNSPGGRVSFVVTPVLAGAEAHISEFRWTPPA